MLKQNKKSGFSLVEIVVVIAILTVLAGVLAPALISHVELSRMQKDESAMSEVINAVQLALSDAEVFDEAFNYCVKNNYLTYSDSSGKYGQTLTDEEFWAPDGSGAAVTITFNPDGNGNYDISKGLINDMTYGNGSVAEKRTSEDAQQCYLSEMGNQALYKAVEQSIGSTLNDSSATYRNSSYTVFIKFNIVDGTRKADVYGQYNGTNLSDNCPAAIGTQTSEYVDDTPVVKKSGGIQRSNFSNSDLIGGGSITGTIQSYRKDCSENHVYLANSCKCKWCGYQKAHTYDMYPDRCSVCGEVKEHECTKSPCPKCGAKAFTFTPAKYDELTGSRTSTDAVIEIPEYFTAKDGTHYIVTSVTGFSDNTMVKNITMPNSVTNILGFAFSQNKTLEKIKLSDKLTSIGGSAFSGCSSLKQIDLPESITNIVSGAFINCISIEKVVLPPKIKQIGGDTFKGCTKLQSVIIPSGITSIGNYAFSNCKSLKSINIPDTVATIGDSAFSNCINLNELEIPNGVLTIGNSAFSGCSGISGELIIPDSITRLGTSCFANCSGISSIKLSNNLEKIETSTFYNCTGLTGQLVLPSSLKTIEYGAFNRCSSISGDLVIPNGTTKIEQYAFQFCSNLNIVIIPHSVCTIEEYAFLDYYGKLTDVYYDGTIEEWAAINSDNMLSNNKSVQIVHCTNGCLNKMNVQITCQMHNK